MYIKYFQIIFIRIIWMTPVLKTSCRLLLWNIIRSGTLFRIKLYLKGRELRWDTGNLRTAPVSLHIPALHHNININIIIGRLKKKYCGRATIRLITPPPSQAKGAPWKILTVFPLWKIKLFPYWTGVEGN